MLAELPNGAQRVIELGGGTGAITRALLAHGVRGDNLLVVELSEELHEHLHVRFPAVRVALGDARELRAVAARCGFLGHGPVDAIISGLGLLAMPVETQQEILFESFASLRPGGRFIQFTYGPQPPVAESVQQALGLSVHRGDFVLRNVPPATVYVYERAV
jgi:phospholipid N-methyltransferase